MSLELISVSRSVYDRSVERNDIAVSKLSIFLSIFLQSYPLKHNHDIVVTSCSHAHLKHIGKKSAYDVWFFVSLIHAHGNTKQQHSDRVCKGISWQKEQNNE